jgi:hypothetical protein
LQKYIFLLVVVLQLWFYLILNTMTKKLTHKDIQLCISVFEVWLGLFMFNVYDFFYLFMYVCWMRFGIWISTVVGCVFTMYRNHVIVGFITLVLARMLRNVIKLMPLGSMIILGVEGFGFCKNIHIVVYFYINCGSTWQYYDKPFLWISFLRILHRRLIVYTRWIWLGLFMRNVNDCVFFYLFMYVECD